MTFSRFGYLFKLMDLMLGSQGMKMNNDPSCDKQVGSP